MTDTLPTEPYAQLRYIINVRPALIWWRDPTPPIHPWMRVPVPQAAAILKVNVDSLLSAIRAGHVACSITDGRKHVQLDEVERWDRQRRLKRRGPRSSGVQN